MEGSIDLVSLVTHASIFVKIIMGILLFASLLCWVTIFRLSSRLAIATRADNYFEKTFWSGVELPTLYKGVQGNPDRSGLEQIFFIGFSEFLKLLKNTQARSEIIEGVERKLRVGLGRQQLELEQGLPLLASIASVSPYIGLLGTVWGIMTAFMGLSFFAVKWLKASAAGIAANNPSAVAIKASAIPGATAASVACAEVDKPIKAVIIPQTVPSRPIYGETEAILASNGNPCSSSSC